MEKPTCPPPPPPCLQHTSQLFAVFFFFWFPSRGFFRSASPPRSFRASPLYQIPRVRLFPLPLEEEAHLFLPLTVPGRTTRENIIETRYFLLMLFQNSSRYFSPTSGSVKGPLSFATCMLILFVSPPLPPLNPQIVLRTPPYYEVALESFIFFLAAPTSRISSISPPRISPAQFLRSAHGFRTSFSGSPGHLFPVPFPTFSVDFLGR